MEMPSRVAYVFPRVLVLALVLFTCSCLKLRTSPMQNLGPILIATTQVDTTPHYRYSNVGSAAGLSMGLYSVAGCGSGLIVGTQQSVNTGQMTAYTKTQPGSYYFGVPTYGACIAFIPAASGSYTLTDTGDYTLSITSP